MNKTLLLASAATLIAFNANAADIKPYVGADIGYSHAELYEPWNIFDDNFVIGSFNVGTKISDYFGLETSVQTSAKTESYGIDLSYNSYGIDAFGYLPVNNNVELFASAGVGFYEFEAEGYGYSLSEEETALRVGLGAQYNINDNWGIRGMLKHAFVDSYSVDNITELSAGVRYSF
ncbi:MAG: porin family protein [Alphaproteobacteria bacterium]|nr:porin family protein [Alphaproteobacteria bacterium]